MHKKPAWMGVGPPLVRNLVSVPLWGQRDGPDSDKDQVDHSRDHSGKGILFSTLQVAEGVYGQTDQIFFSFFLFFLFFYRVISFM